LRGGRIERGAPTPLKTPLIIKHHSRVSGNPVFPSPFVGEGLGDGDKGEAPSRRALPGYHCRELLRGVKPLFFSFPLSACEDGETGGEVKPLRLERGRGEVRLFLYCIIFNFRIK